jgi:hypothetical protein
MVGFLKIKKSQKYIKKNNSTSPNKITTQHRPDQAL